MARNESIRVKRCFSSGTEDRSNGVEKMALEREKNRPDKFVLARRSLPFVKLEWSPRF